MTSCQWPVLQVHLVLRMLLRHWPLMSPWRSTRLLQLCPWATLCRRTCAAASSSSATSFDHALRPRAMPDVLSKSMASGGPKLFGNSKKRPAPQEPQITRGSSGYCDGVASWSQETPDVQPAAPGPANLRVNLDAAVKWGRCPKTDCRHSMRPHLLKSGSRKGQLVLMCSRWWQRGPNNSRACWGSSSFPMSRFEEIPRVLQQQYASVENSFVQKRMIHTFGHASCLEKEMRFNVGCFHDVTQG